MMLSKRMTAKSLELNPASQARKRIVKDSRDCHPAGCDSPPERPPPPPPPLPELGRLFAENEPPVFGEALSLLSPTICCSAIFCVDRGVSGQEREPPTPGHALCLLSAIRHSFSKKYIFFLYYFKNSTGSYFKLVKA